VAFVGSGLIREVASLEQDNLAVSYCLSTSQGSEKTMMTCLNTGFNSTFLDDLCMRRTDEPGAYTECFNDTVGKAINDNL
jgi:hypothetical protein